MKTGPEQEGNINFWMFHLITFGFPVDPLVYITYITSGGDQHSVLVVSEVSLKRLVCPQSLRNKAFERIYVV